MSMAFVQKIASESVPKQHRLDLGDHVVLFCGRGLRVEGNVLGISEFAILIACEDADAWVDTASIAAVARVRSNGSGNGDNGRWIEPSPPGNERLANDGSQPTNRVFCNGQ